MHPLKGSCQEAIHPLYTTFEHFLSVVFRLAYSTHDWWPQTHSCLLAYRVGCVGAIPSTQQDQGLLTSRPQARRLPLATCRAPENRRFPAVSNRRVLTNVMAP